MRRADREFSAETAWAIADRCEYAVLSLTAENGLPYAVPLNLAREGSTFYFHTALEGRLVSLLNAAPPVCLTFVTDVALQPEAYTTRYQSTIAFGTAFPISDAAAKYHALQVLCQHLMPEQMAHFPPKDAACFSRTAAFRVEVHTITGKGNQ